MPLNLLALETSTLRAALAIRRADGRTFTARTDPAVRHGRGLIPALRELLARADLRPTDLEAIAVGLGPGSFTGLRIGLTAAKTLAYATGRPLVGLDSFDVLARNALPQALRVVVLADAQRGELFAAEYQRDAPGAPPARLGPTRIVTAVPYVETLPAGTFVLGPALDRQTLRLPDSVARGTLDQNHPDGLHLLDLAHEAFAAGRREAPWFLEPVYIRRSAAEEKLAAREDPEMGP